MMIAIRRTSFILCIFEIKGYNLGPFAPPPVRPDKSGSQDPFHKLTDSPKGVAWLFLIVVRHTRLALT